LATDFALALRSVGGAVVGHLQVQSSTTDLRATAAQLHALQPDAVFFAGFDRQAGLLLLQMRRQGLQARFITGDAACTQDLVSFWAAGAAADDQVLCALPAGVQAQASPQMAQFISSYAQQYGASPEFYGAYTYDAVLLIGDAVRRAGSMSPAELRQALEHTHGYIGVTGPIAFDSRRDRVAPAVSLYTYRDEQRILLRTLR
jgi:branched-chain amino acid transport system substrate-binding protein